MGAEPAERERRALLGILTLGGLRGRLGRACRQRPGPHLRLARFSAWASLPSWVSLRLELLVAEHSDDGALGHKDQALILSSWMWSSFVGDFFSCQSPAAFSNQRDFQTFANGEQMCANGDLRRDVCAHGDAASHLFSAFLGRETRRLRKGRPGAPARLPALRRHPFGRNQRSLPDSFSEGSIETHEKNARIIRIFWEAGGQIFTSHFGGVLNESLVSNLWCAARRYRALRGSAVPPRSTTQ